MEECLQRARRDRRICAPGGPISGVLLTVTGLEVEKFQVKKKVESDSQPSNF
jgi:hypothetical protein